jgi:MFS family permease
VAAIEIKAARAPATFGTGIVVMLALSVFLNYVDRGNLATAAPLMKTELGLSATQLGLLLSVFFWTYVPGQIVAGYLAERINPYRTLALGLGIWSAATALTGVASTFSMLIALRLLLGVGESVAFPCSSKLLGQHLAPHRLGMANGLIAIGLSVGPAFGTFTGGLLMAHIGWRAVFLLFGLGSMVWLWPWLVMTRHLSTDDDAPKPDNAPAFQLILAKRQLWGAGLGHFCANYAIYFVISWLPLYLVKARGFTVSQMAELGGVIYLVYAASSFITGWVSDRAMARGASSTRVRLTALIGGHLLTACGMLACVLGDTPVAIAGLFAAAVSFGFIAPNLFAVGQTLAGPRGAGKWIGFQNCLGNFAGIIAPIVTGAVVDKTGQFTWAFAVAGAVAIVGVIAWSAIVRRVELLDWPALSGPKTVG